MLRKPGGELRDDDEEKIVEDIYNEVAELNRAPSLRAYEARAHRLLRIADRSDDQRAAKLGARASTIIGDLPPSRLAIDLGKIDMRLGRAASLASYSVDEFVALSAREDHFVNRVLQGPVIWLIGNKETVDALRPLKSRKPGARKAAQR